MNHFILVHLICYITSGQPVCSSQIVETFETVKECHTRKESMEKMAAFQGEYVSPKCIHEQDATNLRPAPKAIKGRR